MKGISRTVPYLAVVLFLAIMCTGHASADDLLGNLPVAFVENRGQWDEAVRFRARRGTQTLWLLRDGWTFSLKRATGKKDLMDGAAVRMVFEGAQGEIYGEARRPGKRHYFSGNDAAEWITGVPAYSRVRYASLYEGIDVVVREKDGHFEYDLLISPDIDPAMVSVRCEGIEGLALAVDGSLVLKTPLGPVIQKPPVTWESGPDGERTPVTCRHVLLGERRFGFAVEGRDLSRPLVIDPGLVYSTYVGGNGADNGTAVAVLPSGEAIVVGTTDSSDFPVTPGAFQTSLKGTMGVGDAFVVRLDAMGTRLVYATYLGGAFSDLGNGVSVDLSGIATITGQSFSPDFPTTRGAFQTQAPGSGDAFVARLSADGSRLIHSTYLGGTKTDQGNAVAVDSSGLTTVTGYAISTDFPTTPGAIQTTQKGSYNVFLTRLDATLSSLVFSTYLGGTKYDIGRAVHVDATGVTAVGGQTGSPDFPVTPGAFQTRYGGPLGFGTDAFVAVVNRYGTKLLYCTYLGGGSSMDSVAAIHMTAGGTVTATGYTLSWDFPTTPGALQTTYGGGSNIRGDGFVTRFDPTGSRALYSTFLGGSGPDDALGLSVNSAGTATVVGSAGPGFPVTPGAYQTAFRGPSTYGSDGFLARLNPAGNALHYATYIGGTLNDSAAAVFVNPGEVATVTGLTTSTDFPTTPGAPQLSLKGRSSTIIARLDMLPTGTARLGTSTPACGGPMVIGVTRMAASPDPNFAFTCIEAPPFTTGYLVLSLGKIPSGFKVLGVTLYVDPASPHIVIPDSTNGAGYAETPLPIPPGIRGVQFHCQYLWANTPQCGGAGTYSASNAVSVTVQ